MNRSTGSLFVGIIIGAAAGYWMTQSNRDTKQVVRDQAMRVAHVARRTAYAVQNSAQRLDPAVRAGRSVVTAAVRSLR